MNTEFGVDNASQLTAAGERAESIMNNLARLLDIVDGSENMDSIEANLARDNIALAMREATKIYADSCGAEWDADDSNFIMNCGYAYTGWSALKYKYTGEIPHFVNTRCPWELYYEALLKEKTVIKAEMVYRKEFCQQIRTLLEKPRGEARTPINGVMDLFHFPDYFYQRIHFLLNRVNMGEMEWEEFTVRVMDNINYLESELSEAYISHYINDAKGRMRMDRELLESVSNPNNDAYENSARYVSEDDEQEPGAHPPSWEQSWEQDEDQDI